MIRPLHHCLCLSRQEPFPSGRSTYMPAGPPGKEYSLACMTLVKKKNHTHTHAPRYLTPVPGFLCVQMDTRSGFMLRPTPHVVPALPSS